MDSKRTKRARDENNDIGLEEHIDAKRRQLVSDREGVPSLQEERDSCRAMAETMVFRWQHRTKQDLLRRARDLEEEIETRLSMQREHRFEATVVTYLRMYYNTDTRMCRNRGSKNELIQEYVKENGRTTEHRSVILDEYLLEMNQAPAKVAMATRDECPKCNEKLLLCGRRSIMSCPTCGYCVSYLDATSTSTSFDDVVEYSQYSYKRVNHYMMWLSLVQGKETHRVPDDIMEEVMQDLYIRQHIRHPQDVTQKRVRESLRKLKLRKAYDHVAQITARISGIRPPRITSETEEQLRNMFLQMQPAFQRHAPKSRTNFLSYSYVLFRCFQILGLHHMLDGLTLLKGRDKLEANDAIFRKMSQDLGWPVFDLPPESETA